VLIVVLPVQIAIASGVLETLVVRPEKMRAQLTGAMLATDFADYLVRKVRIAAAAVLKCCSTGRVRLHVRLCC
jgi:argininosuccinate lyase